MNKLTNGHILEILESNLKAQTKYDLIMGLNLDNNKTPYCTKHPNCFCESVKANKAREQSLTEMIDQTFKDLL